MSSQNVSRLTAASFLLIALALTWSQAIHAGLSGDVWWQWAAGRYMLHHHEILNENIFSYTLYHKPWMTEEWGFEVILAAAVATIGPVAFWLISAGVVSLALLAEYWRLVRRQMSWPLAALLTLATAISLTDFVKDRPQVFSYLFLVLLFIVIESARQTPRQIWWIVPLMMVWTNIHGSFLLGFVVLLNEWLWTQWPVHWGRFHSAPSQLSSRLLGLATISAAVVSLWGNPHGPALWAYAWHVTFSPVISRVIEEWQSPNFHSLFFVLTILAPMALMVLAALVTNKKISWADFLLVMALFYETMHSQRFLAYYALEWPLLFGCLMPADFGRHVKVWAVLPLSLGVVLEVLLVRPIIPPGTPTNAPIAAANYLKHHAGRVFNEYRWGDYLIDRHILVFIDGITDFYLQGPQIAQYEAVANLTQNPNHIWQHYHVKYVLWKPHTAVATFLSQDDAWRLVMKRPLFVLYQRIRPYSIASQRKHA
ncbi:MAG: hypothetical protein OWS74_00435 [Firmicutes bacterium]|nr:hypothetical protein [Bacillota bacterium]